MKTLKSLATNLRKRLRFLSRTKKPNRVLKSQIIAVANQPTRYGYIYTQDCIQEMNRQIQKLIKENRCFGEFIDVADFPANRNHHVIELKNVSHIVEGSKVVGDKLKVDVRLLDTPPGNTAINLLEQAGKWSIGFRPRGTGNVSVSNKVKDYTFISVDMHAVPSRMVQNRVS